MLIDLPFTYRVGLVMPRARLRNGFQVRETATFDVPELSSRDAPLVVETWRADRDDRDIRFPHRSHEGRLHVPIDAGGAAVTPSALSSALAGTGGAPSKGVDGHPTWDLGLLPLSAPPGRHEVGVASNLPELRHLLAERGGAHGGRVRQVDDDRDVSLAHAHATFPKRLVAIDGALWSCQGVAEPVLTVSEGGHNVMLGVGTADRASHAVSRFRADAQDEARRFAEHVVSTVPYNPYGRPVERRLLAWAMPIVHRPDLLGFDQDLDAVEQLLDGYGRVPVGERRCDVAGRLFSALDRLAHVPRPGRDVVWQHGVMKAAADLARRLDLPGRPQRRTNPAQAMLPALMRWDLTGRGAEPDPDLTGFVP